MKYRTLILSFLCMIFTGIAVNAQISGVHVERYYLADTSDQTDTTGGNRLLAGTITYRIFIDLEEGYALKSIFGNTDHRLYFESSDTIFNNADRPNAYFGYNINKAWFSSNPTIALDSWLTLGLATKAHWGIPKDRDPDLSFIGGNYNSGGSSGIAGGLLVNADTSCGLPFALADGLMPFTGSLGQWVDAGFKNLNDEDTTVFGPYLKGTRFESNDALLQQVYGVQGGDPLNQVQVAQISTRGDLRFELNVVLIDTNEFETIFVAANPLENERISPYLTYPPPCGCRDPHYLEYSSLYGCDHPDSCKTLIVLGCMDVNACNYDPGVNFHIQDLCCYPGWCHDRDLSVVCPNLMKGNLGEEAVHMEYYPNPVEDVLHLKLETNSKSISPFSILILDPLGNVNMNMNFPESKGSHEISLDLSSLARGWYILRLINSEGELNAKLIHK